MNISYLSRYLWEKKWLIIFPTLVVLMLAWFFTRKLARDYTSVAVLSTGYMNTSPFEDTRDVNTKMLFNNVVQTLKSDQVLDQVSYKLLYHDLSGTAPFRKVKDGQALQDLVNQFPGKKEGLLKSLTHKIDSFYVLDLAVNTDRKIREIADLYKYSPEALMENVQIDWVDGSDFIRVESVTTNPKLSAFISNEICRRFLALYQNKQGLSSSASIDTLKSLVDTKKNVLDNKLKLLQDQNNLAAGSPDQMLSTLRSQLVQQKSDLISARASLINVNKLMSEAEKKGGLADNEDVIALRNNIDRLYASYVNGGSVDRNLLDQIAKLRTELQQKLSTLAGTAGGTSIGDLQKQKTDLEVKVSVATQTINGLQDNIGTLEHAAQSSAAQQGVIQGIQSEVDVARDQYIQVNNLYNEALNRNRFPGNHFMQIMNASPPMYPNPSKKIKIIGFAGAGVFFVLVFLLLFFEFIDPSIKTPSFLRENQPFPLLANLKRIGMEGPPVSEIFSANGSLPPSKKGFREQIKQLRYELENTEKRIFLITGYHSASGKTTVAQSLAGSLSLNNRKVLLIDTNFHNNTLTKKYGAEPVLENLELDPNDASAFRKVKENIVSVGDNIGLLGCGKGDYTPGEILPQRNIFAWLKKNTSEYDYILIDCAALSKGPDCKELLKYADAVLVVFAADQSFTEEDKKFMVFLKNNEVHTTGVILNKINNYSLDV
jgi:Mrp family chromosome partitioning ATPase/uncharacterized protein involved in exopolysaccharide biosynthesis